MLILLWLNQYSGLRNLLLYINEIDQEIKSLHNQSSSIQEIDNFIALNPNEQKMLMQNMLIEIYSRRSDGRTNHQYVFKQNKTIDNYHYYNYPLSSPTYYSHKKLFDRINQTKNSFLYQWRNNEITHWDNLLKMCYFYIRDINTNNFHQFKIPSSLSYDDNAKKFNSYVDLLNPSYVEKIKFEHQNNLNKIEELKEGKIEIINTIKNTYLKEDIMFIIDKMDINPNIKQEFFKNLNNNIQ